MHEEKLAAIGRLAGAIAHEVRNPVAMIVSALGLATAAGTDQAEQRQWCVVASDEARRLEASDQGFPDLRPAEGPGPAADLARGHARLRGRPGTRARSRDRRAASRGVRRRRAGPGRPLSAPPGACSTWWSTLSTPPLPGADHPRRRRGRRRRRGSSSSKTRVRRSRRTSCHACSSRSSRPGRRDGPRWGLAIARTIARAHGGDLELSANRPRRVRFTLRVLAPPPAERES